MTSFTVFVFLQLFVWCSGMEIPVGGRMVEDDRHIIGGRNASISEFPYVVSLQWRGMFICGGTIISEKFILTAAHCFRRRYNSDEWNEIMKTYIETNSVENTVTEWGESKKLPNISQRGEEKHLTVRVGSSYIEKEGFVHNVKRAVKHPKYTSIDYDAAVIELEEPIKFNENASAIEISDSEPQHGDTATVTGYGIYDLQNLELPPVLQTVDIQVVSSRVCQIFFSHLTPRMFCTWGKDKAPYSGDSGGPIVLHGKVAGAVSFGFKGATSKPSAYSKFVNKSIREFIKKETGI